MFGYTNYLISRIDTNGIFTYFLGSYVFSQKENFVDFDNFNGSLSLKNLETGRSQRFVYYNGRRFDNFKISPQNNARTSYIECADEITCTWYSDCTTGVSIASTKGLYSCPYPNFPPECGYGASWTISEETLVEPVCWWENDPLYPDDPGFPEDWDYSMDPTQAFSMQMVITPPPSPIYNLAAYLNCLNTSVAANKINLTIYVDRPRNNSNFSLNVSAQGGHVVGHAFVEIEKQMPNSSPYFGAVIRRTLGFYPSSAVNPSTLSSTGIMNHDDNYNGSIELAVTFSITESELSSLTTFIGNYTSNNYNLFNNNCGHFASNVMSQIGVTLPNAWENQIWYYTYNPYTTVASPVYGPSLGKLEEDLRSLTHSKITNKATSNISPKLDNGCLN